MPVYYSLRLHPSDIGSNSGESSVGIARTSGHCSVQKYVREGRGIDISAFRF